MGGFVEGFENALRELPGVRERYEVPRPAWHGHWQALYLFEGSSPFHMLDFVVMEEGSRELFLETERHGSPRPIFDKSGVLAKAVPLDRGVHGEKVRARIPVLVDSFHVLHWLVDKEILRGRAIDAIHFRLTVVMPRLVEMLRIRFTHERHDFSSRYLGRDLPAEVHARLVPLFFVLDLHDLAAKKASAVAMFEEAADALGHGRAS